MSKKNLLFVARADEPCDCSSHVRHNNGGNYHAEYLISFDKKQGCFTYYEGSTCELVDYQDEPIDETKLTELLQQFQQYDNDGWYVEIDWDMISQLKNLDIEKIRRRTRNLLNETAKREDILTCACVLGAKLF